MIDRCPHTDVRYFADEKGAVACMNCGRLFGHLSADEVFVPHNPNLAGAGILP